MSNRRDLTRSFFQNDPFFRNFGAMGFGDDDDDFFSPSFGFGRMDQLMQSAFSGFEHPDLHERPQPQHQRARQGNGYTYSSYSSQTITVDSEGKKRIRESRTETSAHDDVVETRQMRRDDDKEEATWQRLLGDKGTTQSVKKSQGRVDERLETLHNIDQTNRNNFEDEWQKSSKRLPSRARITSHNAQPRSTRMIEASEEPLRSVDNSNRSSEASRRRSDNEPFHRNRQSFTMGRGPQIVFLDDDDDDDNNNNDNDGVGIGRRDQKQQHSSHSVRVDDPEEARDHKKKKKKKKQQQQQTDEE